LLHKTRGLAPFPGVVLFSEVKHKKSIEKNREYNDEKRKDNPRQETYNTVDEGMTPYNIFHFLVSQPNTSFPTALEK